MMGLKAVGGTAQVQPEVSKTSSPAQVQPASPRPDSPGVHVVKVSDVDSDMEAITPPSTWHEIVLYKCLLDETTGPAAALLWALSLGALVICQMIALVAVLRSLDPYSQPCADSGGCAKGYFCNAWWGPAICDTCSYPPAFCDATALANAVDITTPLAVQHGSFNATVAAGAGHPFGTLLRLMDGRLAFINDGPSPQQKWMSVLKESERLLMCDGCQKKVTGYANPTIRARDNAVGMVWYDWMTFVMIGGMIALIVWSECEDVKVAGARLWSHRMPLRSPRQILRMWLFIVEVARHFMVVPLLLLSIPVMVLNEGGDAKSQCLNTVAILFILDIDELLVSNGLGSKLKASLEEAPQVLYSKRGAMLFGGLRYLTMLTVLVALFTPILFFRRGFLSSSVTNVCLDIVFFIWFLQACVELLLLLVASERRRIDFLYGLGGLVALMFTWICVNFTTQSILIYIYANGDPEWTMEMSKDINNGHTLIPFNHLQEDMKHQYALQSYTEYIHWTNDIGYSYGNYFNYGGVHALD